MRDLRASIDKVYENMELIKNSISMSGPAPQVQANMAGLQVGVTLLLVQSNLIIAEAILELRKR